MAESSGPFDGSAPDNIWFAAQWYTFAQIWAQSAVIGSPPAGSASGPLALSVNGLGINIAAGTAWVRGAGYRNDAPKAFTVPANTNASLSRRDRVVLRRDLLAKTVTAVLLQGTPAASPVAPTLTQVESGVWDVPLFSFLVPPSSGTVLTGIVDERWWSSDVSANRMRATGTGDASATSTGHAFQAGPDDGQNTAIDGNEIVARSNGALAPFGINATRFMVPPVTANGDAVQYQSTAWTDWGVVSGWTRNWSKYRVLNGVFYWTASLTRTSWAAGQDIASLSAQYRPGTDFIVFGTFSKEMYDIYVGADGVVEIAQAGTGGLVIGGSWPVG